MDAPPTRLSAADARRLSRDPDVAQQYPPLLTPAQAAELLQVPLGTIYDWRSQGRLDDCSFRAGGCVRIVREKLLARAFEGKLRNAKRKTK